MHNCFKIKPRVAYIIETAGIMRRKQQEATLLWGLSYRLEKIRVLEATLLKGCGDRAIFIAVATEQLVSHNTPVTKIIHSTARQAQHGVLNGELFFKVIRVKLWSNTTSPIFQWQNEPLVCTVLKERVFATWNALADDGFYIAVSENTFLIQEHGGMHNSNCMMQS